MTSLADIRRAALDYLARREHSERELQRKLLKKDFPREEIRLVIEELAQKGFLSNARFIENYIHARRNKGYGPLRIRAELLERGITEDFIEHHLNMTDNAWFMNARETWKKRFKNQLPRDVKTRAQQLRFLHYRGFTHEQINSIFKSDDLTCVLND